jgi:hypothetical protein
LHCQQPLHVRHILNGCEADGLYDKLVAALRTLDIPTPRSEDDIYVEGIVRKVRGFPAEWPDFTLSPGQPIYTDGSAIHVTYPEIAQAAASVYQLDAQGVSRSLHARVPSQWPVSAVTAEFLTIELATRFLPAEPDTVTDMVIDCSSVVKAIERKDYHQDYRAKHAGFLKTPALNMSGQSK